MIECQNVIVLESSKDERKELDIQNFKPNEWSGWKIKNIYYKLLLDKNIIHFFSDEERTRFIQELHSLSKEHSSQSFIRKNVMLLTTPLEHFE